MAAYAAVVSLMNNLELMQNHPSHSFSFDKEQIQCLVQYVSFFLDFLESYTHGAGSEGNEALESQIASAAHEADDVIESHIVDQLLAGSTLHRGTNSCFLADLQKVIENMDSVKKMVIKVQAERGDLQLPTYPTPAASSIPLTSGKNGMVGFDDELIHLLDVLTGQQSSLQIISITGMGGMGKTTLAKNVNENSLIVQHFDIRMWATISQECNARKILSELLSCQGKSISEIDLKTEDALLGEKLFKNLWARRYLIILDDIWSIVAWDNVKIYFPDNHNGSRIVMTSRQSDVANHFASLCLAMNFLDEENSWILFCKKAFAEEGCPPELEETGQMIVKKCKGLPLLIVLIGGHLAKSSRTKEYWEKVGNDMTSILDSGEEEQFFDILYLSYSYLPAHLKPCFLYMGIFPEDHKISVSRLVKLWVAEGFLKPNKAQTLEEVGEGCLKDLVDRSLILVRKWNWNGKIKTCNVHDLLRELCLKVGDKEKFIYVLKLRDNSEPINKERRLVIQESTVDKTYYPGYPSYCVPRHIQCMESAPLTRSLLCNDTWGIKWSFDCRLLKVLRVVEGVADEVDGRFQELKLHQVNLRYLHCSSPYMHTASIRRADYMSLSLPSSISMLWNLQTLIIYGYHGDTVAPSQIWKMPQLRHVQVGGIYLPDPPSNDQQNDLLALQNLQTLIRVSNLRLSEDVCKRIPNIKKLHVRYSHIWRDCEASSYYSPHNLGRFQKLETLKLTFPKEPNSLYSLLSFTFPSSLQKLSLTNCYFQWEDLTMFGLLPHLEVLKLHLNSVGSQWNPVEGEFLHLKVLIIYADCDNGFNYWNAESCHFPLLEELVLEGLNKLGEIPSGIGEISTLRYISLKDCSMSAAISAVRILVEQESLGNEGLQLELQFWDDEEHESFREMVQAEDLSSNNLRL